MGASKWCDDCSRYLKGANIIILPDSDQPGKQHAEQAKQSLTGIAASIKTIELPGLPQAGDPYDWIKSGGRADVLCALIDGAHGAELASLIMSSREFVAGYVAPQYLIEGILQRRRIYSLTDKTGDGKTALQIYMAYLLATATKLGKREAKNSRF
jgi:hypothetical protein